MLTDASDAGGIGWYRKDFRVPAAPGNLSWILRFESVNNQATISIGLFIPIVVAFFRN